MESPHTQDFHVRDLPTRSVTLFPSQAQIVREIKNVTLKPGPNEITVVGVTPTADEHSIKVEGTGSATITDITVKLLPNRDIFQEIYPDSDSESESEATSEEDDDDDDKVNDALEEVRDKLIALKDEQKRAREVISSSESRLKILDSYNHSLERKCGVNIEASIETYRVEREKVFQDHMDGAARERDLAKEILKLTKEKTRLEKVQAKEKAKADREKAKVKRAKEKLREKQERREREALREKVRVRQEREQFWPRSCYTIKISLDAGANFTPGSSRRSSISSLADVKLVTEKDKETDAADDTATSITCDLTLSYVTSSAFWAPSYDLALSSTSNTGTLSFDAQLTNMTSETWANSKVTLSTSQASFSGLHDDTPKLVPWRLKIVGKLNQWEQADIVHSHEEQHHKQLWSTQQNNAVMQKPRAGLFGVNPNPFQQAQAQAQAQSLFGKPMQKPAFGSAQMNNQMAPAGFGSAAPQAKTSALFGGSANANANTNTNNYQPGGGLFGNSNNTNNARPMPPPPPAAPTGPPRALARSAAAPTAAPQSEGLFEPPQTAPNPDDAPSTIPADNLDGQTILDAAPLLNFQDSSFEETGLTSTYDLPHLKTLPPSTTPSKQRVARITFTSITFTRTVVPKYKPAAYLRATLRNTSKLTLLRGPTGLTLDGSFLGRSTLPRCSAGDTFSIPLGVDPAVRVAYPKPEVTRSTTGMFTKGENAVYTRSVTLVNTRAAAGKPVAITVLDQVPVSEDEKIRVDLLTPAGLSVSTTPGVAAKGVVTGEPGRVGGRKEDKEWGKATAVLRKEGEVQWNVSLDAGKSVKLVLRYEVAFPTGERVAQVY
ncbi:hypothetical protein B0J18DRAFT_487702 [Chaetomium sp. MPI-SDFR-AT-0129]|nr:hypothetical protein B0J18DRAFT_487702 [Chaetomium sp. MPI-SDFR-AT-0129]